MMSNEILDHSESTVTFQISGQLSYADYVREQKPASEILHQARNVRGLLLRVN